MFKNGIENGRLTMSAKSPKGPDAVLRVSKLSTKAPTRFERRPDAAQLSAIAAELDLLGLRKLSLVGTLEPEGRNDWRLRATLGVTVVQPCVATLEPVTTRIDEPVERQFLADFDDSQPTGEEAEMPEDDTTEPLHEMIDLDQMMIEALALALPLYPRAKDAAPADLSVTEPGKKVLSDDDVKPFAGLAALRDQLADKTDGDAED